MNILIVIKSMKTGGAEKQAVVDANYLIKRGHDVTIAINEDGKLRELLSDKVNIYKISSSNVILAGLQLYFHLLKTRYDIIHAHMFWAEKVVAFSGKLTFHKVLFNEHGLGLWRKWYHIAIMRFISLFADKIVNACEATKNIRHKREKIPLHKLDTLYNSFELKSNGATDLLSANDDNNKPIRIGFVGRFNKIKQLETFVEIAKQLSKRKIDFKIYLVGDGEEKDNIEKLIKENNLSEYFELPGFVINPYEYYKKIDIFILPSKREAFSVALLEAGGSGLACIAYDVGGNAEIIQNEVTGFIIEKYDVDKIVEKILYLNSDKNTLKQMKLNAKKFIESNFSINRRIENLEKIYKEVCNR